MVNKPQLNLGLLWHRSWKCEAGSWRHTLCGRPSTMNCQIPTFFCCFQSNFDILVSNEKLYIKYMYYYYYLVQSLREWILLSTSPVNEMEERSPLISPPVLWVLSAYSSLSISPKPLLPLTLSISCPTCTLSSRWHVLLLEFPPLSLLSIGGWRTLAQSCFC